MIEWLEGYLRRGNKTLLMVTHDRYFLDEVCNLILEIDDETIYTYRGNYSYYLEKRQERIDNARAEIARANNLYPQGTGTGCAGSHRRADTRRATGRRRLRPGGEGKAQDRGAPDASEELEHLYRQQDL